MQFGTPPRGPPAPASSSPVAASVAAALFASSSSSPAPRRPGGVTSTQALASARQHRTPSPLNHRPWPHPQDRLSPAALPSRASPSDRYVSASSQQAKSIAHFLLTARERTTPMLIRAAQRMPHAAVAYSASRESSPSISSSLDVANPSPTRYGTNRSLSHRGAASPRSQRSLPRAGSNIMATGSSHLSEVFAKMHLDPSVNAHSSRERSRSSPSQWRGAADGDAATGNEDDRHRSSSPVSMACEAAALETEPYPARLARTLFSDVEQSTVLSVNSPSFQPSRVRARGSSYDSESGADAGVEDRAMRGSLRGEQSITFRGDGTDENEVLDFEGLYNEEENGVAPTMQRRTQVYATAAPLATSEVTQFGMSEGARYEASLGVVFECNRARNFTTPSFRMIPHTPQRILDAAEIEDDFYMNLMDWSATSDVLCVALQRTVYLWNAKTCGITELPPVSEANAGLHGSAHWSNTQLVCGLNWAPDGSHLAVGRSSGAVELWDVETLQLLHTYRHHSDRVVSLSWDPQGGGLLASGSRDSTIVLRDVRERDTTTANLSPARPTSVLQAHATEVCGLKWSPNGVMLASGGNDNQVLLWDRRTITAGRGSGGGSRTDVYRREACQPVFFLNKHTAAVKALSWNPTQPALLASGGGSHDKTLRFWNSLTGECVHHINTGSQICGVVWNRAGTELVTAHGYTDNQLSIWRYPSLRRIANLVGHTSRVLHLALSADGETVVSAAADETLRFWACFPSSTLREASPYLYRSAYSSPKPASSVGDSPYAGGGETGRPGGASSPVHPRKTTFTPGRCGSFSSDRDALSLTNEEVSLR